MKVLASLGWMPLVMDGSLSSVCYESKTKSYVYKFCWQAASMPGTSCELSTLRKSSTSSSVALDLDVVGGLA